MSKKATAALAVREAARLRLATMNADRAAREAAVIDAAAEYAERTGAQERLCAQLADLDAERGRLLSVIVAQGETNARAAELVGSTAAEVARLRRLGAAPAGPGTGDPGE
jgi:hypothetical protein